MFENIIQQFLERAGYISPSLQPATSNLPGLWPLFSISASTSMDVSELTLLEADDGIMSDSAGSLDTIGQTKVKHLTRSRFDEKFKYKQIRALGHGGNGNCFLLERRSDKELRVVKVVHGLGNRKDTVENREVKILRDVLPQNERILRIYEVIHNVRTSQVSPDSLGFKRRLLMLIALLRVLLWRGPVCAHPALSLSPLPDA